MFIPPLEYLSRKSITLFEYVPLASTLTGLYQIFHAYAPSSFEEDFSGKPHSYRLLSGKKSWRSYVMLLPILGNIILLGYDKILFSRDQKCFAFLQNSNQFADPQLHKLCEEIKVLSQNELKNNLPYMKALKDQWERVQNDLLCEQDIQSALGSPSDQNIQKLLDITEAKIEVVSEKVFYLKKEKNIRNAGDLKYARTYREILPAAYAGKETAIKGFIKLGQEAQPIQKIKQGPSPKAQNAEEMNRILNMLQEDKDSVQFSLDMETKKYIVTGVGGRVICKDFQKVLLGMDWSQVVLKEENSISAWSIVSPVWYLLTRGSLFPQGPMRDEEYRALNIEYLRNGYAQMNSLLRGDYFSFDENGKLKQGREAIRPAKESAQLNEAMKQYLLATAHAIHGLYKLPDYKDTKKYLWRGERWNDSTKFENEIRRRIRAIGKAPEPSVGFTSTSAFNLLPTFAGSACLTLLRNGGGGKDVRKYSPYNEQEILFPPTKMQWLYHKQLKDGVHLFIARPVQTY